MSRPHSGQTRCVQQAGSPASSCPVAGDEGTPARSSSIDAVIRHPFVRSGQPAAGSRFDHRRFNGVFVPTTIRGEPQALSPPHTSVPPGMGAGPLALHGGRRDGNGGSSPDGCDGGRRSPGPPLPSWQPPASGTSPPSRTRSPENYYRTTLIAKLAAVLVPGVRAFLHARLRSTAGLALFGTLAGASALTALFPGILLAGRAQVPTRFPRGLL